MAAMKTKKSEKADMPRLSEMSSNDLDDMVGSPSLKDIFGSRDSDGSKEMDMRQTKTSGAGTRRRGSVLAGGLDKGNRVHVAVRFRPLNNLEKTNGSKEVWSCTDKKVEELEDDGRTSTGKTWEFDNVFSAKAATTDLYDKQCKTIVQGALDGYNGTVFAYGQTSSGKTYTVMGDPKNNPGVMPQAILDIFEWVNNNRNTEWDIYVSFVEIYNEQITDLLQSNSKKAVGLKIYEDKLMGPSIKDVVEWRALNSRHCLDCFREGEKRRALANTAMNENSSRSHALFRLRVESRNVPQTSDEERHAESMADVASKFLRAQEDLAADHASLYLVDPRANELYVQAGEITLRIQMNQGVAGSVASSGITANIADAYQDSRFNPNVDKKTGYRTRSILCMPVWSKGESGEILGVVQFINKTTPGEPSFTSADEERVKELTNYIGPLLYAASSMARITTCSILNLVDLAGSERIKKSGTTAANLKKETAFINTSLMMLGTCVSQLSEGRTDGHIPFRNSKLTHLLATSLGGNANTCIIANCSPATRNRSETISTLSFASRAMRIVNHTKQNVTCDQSDLVDAYEAEITRLKNELRKVTNPAFKMLGMGVPTEDGQGTGLVLHTSGLGNMLNNVVISQDFLGKLRKREDEAASAEQLINQQGVEPKVKFCPMMALKAHSNAQAPVLVVSITSVTAESSEGTTTGWLTEEAFEKHVNALRGEESLSNSPPITPAPRSGGMSIPWRAHRRGSSVVDAKQTLQREDWELSYDSAELISRARELVKEAGDPTVLPATFIEEVRMTAVAVEEANLITEKCRPRDDLVFVADITMTTHDKPVAVTQLYKRREKSDISEMLYVWDTPEMLARLQAMRNCLDSYCTTGYLLQDDEPDPWYDETLEPEQQHPEWRPSSSRRASVINLHPGEVQSPHDVHGMEQGDNDSISSTHDLHSGRERLHLALPGIPSISRQPSMGPGSDGEGWSPKSPRSPFSPGGSMRKKLSINPDRLNRIKSIPRKKDVDDNGMNGVPLLASAPTLSRSSTKRDESTQGSLSGGEGTPQDTSRTSSKVIAPEAIQEAADEEEGESQVPMTSQDVTDGSPSPVQTDEEAGLSTSRKDRTPGTPPAASSSSRATPMQPGATGAQSTRVVYRMQRDGLSQDRSHTPMSRTYGTNGSSMPSNVRVGGGSHHGFKVGNKRDVEQLRRSLPGWNTPREHSGSSSGHARAWHPRGYPLRVPTGHGSFMQNGRMSPFAQSAPGVPVFAGYGGPVTPSMNWQEAASRNPTPRTGARSPHPAGSPSVPPPHSIGASAASTPRDHTMARDLPMQAGSFRSQSPWGHHGVVAVREPMALNAGSLSTRRRIPEEEDDHPRGQEDSIDSGATGPSQDLAVKDRITTGELRSLLKDVVREVVKEEVSPLRDYWSPTLGGACMSRGRPWSAVPLSASTFPTSSWATSSSVRPASSGVTGAGLS